MINSIAHHFYAHWSLKLIVVLWFTVSSAGQALAEWPVQFGGVGDDEVVDMAVDGDGNVIVVGMFEGSSDYSGSALETPRQLISAGERDIFVASFNSGGAINWATRVGGSGDDVVNAVAVDPTDGSIFITGNIGNGTASFVRPGLEIAAGRGFKAKFYAGGVADWAHAEFSDPTRDHNADLSLVPAIPAPIQGGESIEGRLFSSYVEVVRVWKGWFAISSLEGAAGTKKFIDGDAYRLRADRIAAAAADEFYVLGSIGGYTDPGDWCGTTIESGIVYPWLSWQFIAKYAQQDNGAWECQWLTKVDENDYRGDIVAGENQVYYSSAGLITVLNGSNGDELISSSIVDRTQITSPTPLTEREADYYNVARTTLGGLAVDDDQNIFISGVYVGEPEFDGLGDAEQLPAATTPTVFIAKYSANLQSAEGIGWQWATATDTPPEEANIDRKNTRLALSPSGNTLFVAGSTSGREYFIDSAVGPQPGALSFDGVDNRLEFAVPDRVDGKEFLQYALSFDIKIPTDAVFPLALVNSPVMVNDQEKLYQIFMPDAGTIEIREPVNYAFTVAEYSDALPESLVASFTLDTALEKDVWYKLDIERKSISAYSSFDEVPRTISLAVNGELVDEQNLLYPILVVPLDVAWPSTLVFGGSSSGVNAFQGQLDNLSVSVSSYQRNETEPVCLGICTSTTSFTQPETTESQWRFDTTATTVTDILPDAIGTNDIDLTNVGDELSPSQVSRSQPALSFDGEQNQLIIPIPHALDAVIPTYDISFQVWFANDAQYPQVLLSDNNNFHLVMTSATRLTVFEAEEYFDLTLDEALPTGQWHTLRVTRTTNKFFVNDNDYTLTLWVNGVAMSDPLTYDGDDSFNDVLSAQSLTFGQTEASLAAFGDPFTTVYGFKGFLSDLSVNADVFPSTYADDYPDETDLIRLAGRWVFDTPMTDPVIPNVSGFGSTLDIDLTAASVDELPTAINTTAFSSREGYISLLNANTGDWLIPQSWEIGEALTPPGDAVALQPDIKIDGQLATDAFRYFYWSPSEGKLYAIGAAPGVVTIEWRKSNDIQDESRSITIGAPVQRSTQTQSHIADVPVELEPASVDGDSLRFSAVVYPANQESLVAVNSTGTGKVFNRSAVTPGQSPYVVLQYTVTPEGEQPNPDQQASVFQVVYTKDWQDSSEQSSSCTIGQSLTNDLHDPLSGRNGYIINNLARYDASLYGSGTGPIFPVNLRAGVSPDDALAVVWYTGNDLGQYWGDTPVEYECAWPSGPEQIVIANQQGFEMAASVSNPSIYRQANPALAGFNPNEEHALLENNRVYALRNDLNSVMAQTNAARSSLPYVLLKYQDAANDDAWAFEVLAIESSTTEEPFGPADGNTRYRNEAGQVLPLPQPLPRLGVCEDNTITIDPSVAAWQDHTGVTWARAEGDITLQYYYPLQEGFDYDLNDDGIAEAELGACIPWLDQLAGQPESTTVGTPINVNYRFEWPVSVPLMKPGETLFKSKEVPCSDDDAAADSCYLPQINGQAAAQIIFDQTVDAGASGPADALVKLIDPLSSRSVPLEELSGAIATVNLQGKTFFSGLPYVLRSRLSYDSINKTLAFKGSFDDSQIGDPHLLPNIMTGREKDTIQNLEGANNDFEEAVEALYNLSRNPELLDLDDDENPDIAYLVGVQGTYLGQGIDEDGDGVADNFADSDSNLNDDRLDKGNYSLPAGQFLVSAVDKTQADKPKLLGTPMALSAGRPAGEGYVTLAFNNDPSLGSLPVSLQVLKLDASQGVYQGNIWIVPSDNIFEEALTLRHSGDFAGDPDLINIEWYSQPDTNGQPAAPPLDETLPLAVLPSEWKRHPDSLQPGALDITISGPGLLTLSDNWFISRYGGDGPNTGLPVGDNDNFPSPWAGDPSQPADAPKAMLATGWIKRVIAGLNPFDQRVSNFHTDEVNTLTSMIAQAGEPFTGPIPFNPDPDVVNGVGIIEAYQTVLNRGKDLSIKAGFNDIAANTQLLNAATRIADLYTLLANEAYADAQDPTIGFNTGSQLGTLASSIFAFQNQLVSPLEEELVLLRGRDDSRAGVAGHPVNNRLFWNFTQGTGEVAYVQSYGITDQNGDGFINETDARILYPQGHGDAWGHYLTSVKSRYQLLQEENYTWVPRTESVLVAGVPIEIDYLDERKFAAAAGAKARAGAEIVDLTYREKYVEAPAGQWQGYKDTDRERAWGLDGWGRRGGQGAYFDWLTANAILPAEDPNPDHVGIEKIDRTTVAELNQIIAGYAAIQGQMDKADAGLNPLGLAKGVVPFDIDPSFLQVSSAIQGQNHFDQIASRAQKALDNAVRVFDHASQQTQSLRNVQDDVNQVARLVTEQEQAYKHRLIEIFGYPYAGDMGGGKTYPSDYDGPDLEHYQYVSTDLTGELPEPDGSFTAFFKPMAFGGTNAFVFPGDSLNEAYTNVDAGDVKLTEFPITSGSDWPFVAPSSWNKRRAPGQLQVAISDMLQAQAQLQKAIKQHESLLQQIEGAAALVEAEYRLNIDSIGILTNQQDGNVGLDAGIVTARAVSAGAAITAKLIEETGEAGEECFPTSVGFSVDATAPARCAVAFSAAGLGFNAAAFGVVADTTERGLELAKENAELQSSIDLLAETPNVILLERIKELEQLWRQEAVLRLELFTQSEVVNQSLGTYYAKLAEGQRLLEERRTFRVFAAGDTQQNRYRDLTFRIFRNDALAKYRAQFDLAARYVYLAAAAYDYETNLLGGDSGSGRDFLADIVRQRSLGQVVDGVPVAGTPGLADVLARLTQNFEVYRGQLGFNNPQVEQNRFSLRKELFRQAGNDADWRETLEQSRVANLWDIPEFRRYVRPFTVESAGEQPGLVIRFPTTVTFGLNFFGHELGGGDSAYDPTNFATKVRAVGTWFTGYDGAALSNTPRVYLVPVGMDVLRSPSGDDFKTREWRVVDQKLPAPFPIGASDLTNPDWIPLNDTLSETYGDIRRMSSFRAYHDSGEYDSSQSISDSRLVGRSVWNSEWMLIIPGGTLQFDPEEGLNRFIHGQLTPDGEGRDGTGITDILLHFQTYGFSGN